MSFRSPYLLFSLPVIALGSALPHAALAQTDPGTGDGADEIVVTAARTTLPPNALPLTIDVIDKTALDQQIAISGSVTDAVSNLTPSFSPTRQKLSGAGETLRGRSPLYAINGIPQSTPLRDGSRDGFTIDGFFVDRVELIYGSNALQGIGGTGGIVNQVTVGAPKKEGLGGRVLLQGSAGDGFEGDGLGGKAAGLLEYKAGRFDIAAGAAYEKRGVYYDGDGRRVGLNLTQGETQDSHSLSLFARLGYQLTDTGRFDLIASRFKMQDEGDYVAVAGNRLTGRPTSAVRGDPPGIAAASRTESVALSYTDSGIWGGHLVSQVFWNRTHDTFGAEVAPIATFQDVRIAPVGTLIDQSENRSRKIGGKISYERTVPGLEALTTTIGFDVLTDRTEQRLILTNRTWVPPTDYRSLAPFVQANLALFDKKLRLAGGVRYENVRIKIADYRTLASTTTPAGGVAVSGGSPTFEATLFNGGVVLEPVPGIRGYLSYAEGYTVPDIGRITRAVSKPGVDIDSFLDIAPVISNNREIGVEVKRGPLDGSVAYFWSSSDKGQLLIANPGGIFDVQRLRVEIQGLEVNLGVKLPVPGARVSIGYAHLIGRYDSDAVPDGKVDSDLDGTNISPDRLNLAADYVRGRFRARVQSRFFLARTFQGKLRDPRNDFGGYTLVDATARYQTGFGGITLSVSNLLDKQYIDYSSDTRLPTDNLSYFAGRGRSFTLGWDYKF
jgi:iron complex outermembrane receptor protein